MKYLLAGSLCFIFSTFSSVTSATDSLEYTIRQIYQPYIKSTPVATFGGAMVSARMGQALTLDERLTLPGDMGWLGYDPICNCQDFDNLVLENVAITRKDASHAEATVRFRPFRDQGESVTQTLSMMMENRRWVIDDIISEQDSLYQQLNASNQQTLAALSALQRPRPEDFIRTLYQHIDDNTWPWTWIVSPDYDRVINAYQHAVSRQDADRSSDGLLYHNPLCDCIATQPVRLNTLNVMESTLHRARVQVNVTIGKTAFTQEIVLQRIEDEWKIADVIRRQDGSLMEKMRAATARIEQQ